MLVASLSGCGVVAVAGAATGAAISVAGAVVSTGVKVTGKVIEKTIDAGDAVQSDPRGVTPPPISRSASASPR